MLVYIVTDIYIDILVPIMLGPKPAQCALCWPRNGIGVIAPNFMECVVVNAHG